MPHCSSIYWRSDIIFSLLLYKHWLRQHLLSNCLYWISDRSWLIWSTNPLKYGCKYQFVVVMFGCHGLFTLPFHIQVSLLPQTIVAHRFLKHWPLEQIWLPKMFHRQQKTFIDGFCRITYSRVTTSYFQLLYGPCHKRHREKISNTMLVWQHRL